MIDYKFIEMIERVGYINKEGERICGTAALLHFLNLRVSGLSESHIARGRAYVQKYLSA